MGYALLTHPMAFLEGVFVGTTQELSVRHIRLSGLDPETSNFQERKADSKSSLE